MKSTVWICAVILTSLSQVAIAQLPVKSGIERLRVKTKNEEEVRRFENHDEGIYLIRVIGNESFLLNNDRIKTLRREGENEWIVKLSAEDKNQLQKAAIEPVNFLWKISRIALQVPNNKVHDFLLRVTDNLDVMNYLKEHDLPITASGNSMIVVRCTLNEILDKVVTLPSVDYIGIENLEATIESKVLDMNLSPNAVNKVHSKFPSLKGQGMTVSIKEGGFNTNDIDLLGRTVISSVSPSSVDNHATDMATIIAGAGNSFVTGHGVAPSVTLTASDFTNLQPDEDVFFSQLNISTQNHSYGTEIENFYGLLAAQYDESAHRNPEVLHVFTSGNSGTSTSSSGNYDGIAGFSNMTGNFKQAKNVLVVGAVDTARRAIPFSSSGPAYDGRIKPDVVAYSTVGTSNAAALVSGVSLLIQQRFKDIYGTLPASALVKAFLINSADDVGLPGPDFKTGYGNVNAYRAIEELDKNHYFSSTIANEETKEFDIILPASARNLKITLAWNDPVAPVDASIALVNDLDLKVTFNETSWLPWKLDHHPSLNNLFSFASRNEDHLNNVEQVSLKDVEAGIYKITIAASNLLSDQEFFVAYQWDGSGEFEWYFPTATDNMPYNGETATNFYWHSTVDETFGVLEYSIDNEESWNIIHDQVDLSKGYLRWENIPEINNSVVARMRVGTQLYESDVFTISRPTRIRTGFNCQDTVMLQWNRIKEASAYRLLNLKDNLMSEAEIVNDTFVIVEKNAFDSRYFTIEPILGDKPGIRSETIDYNSLGNFCFVNSFFDELSEEGIYLNLSLGTGYGVKTVMFEREIDNMFQPLHTYQVDDIVEFRFLDQSPLTGLNRYRATITFDNDESYITDIVENFFVPKNQFLVFPNPALTTDELRVYSAPLNEETIKLILFKSDGTALYEQLLTSDREFVSLTHIPSGLYLYRVISLTGTASGKLVIIAR